MIFSCSTERMVPKRFENQLVITKKYMGKVFYTKVEEHYTLVVMSEGIVWLCGQVIVPEGAAGFVRTLPVYMDVSPSIRAQLEHKYFSYLGCEKEYRVRTW